MKNTESGSLALHDYAGVLICQATEDINLIDGRMIPKDYVNATQMCVACNKRLRDWEKLKTTEKLIQLTLDDSRVPNITEIIKVDGDNRYPVGTWVSFRIAMNLAQWLSPEFALWAGDVLTLHMKGDFQALTTEALEAQKQIQAIWDRLRQVGILTRNQFTDAVKQYMVDHPELSDNDRQWMYPNVSDQINQYVFGKKAKQLCVERNCDSKKLRNSHNPEDLRRIELIENVAAKQIGKGKHPKRAVELAIEFLYN